MFNINHIEEHTHIYGPGIRTAIWFQGCSILCSGCWNKDMLSFDRKKIISANKLVDFLLSIPNIEGITLLGGEPLDQNKRDILKFLKLIKNTNLSIILFTGYDKENISSSILKHIDILISGKYEKEKRTLNNYLIGSTNQDITFISNRYSSNDIEKNANYQEIIIDEYGKETWLGFPLDSD